MEKKHGCRTRHEVWAIIRRLGPLGALVLASVGCSTDREISIGENVGSELTDYSATWDGYAEAFAFDDGSDRVRLTIDAAGNGTFRVGARELYPPPANFDVGWPLGTFSLEAAQIRSGLAYPLYGARIESKRIRLGVDTVAPYQPWCAHQTPVPDPVNTNYACTPNWASWQDRTSGQDCGVINPDTGERTPIECGKFFLCDLIVGVCSCVATGCSVSSPELGAPGQTLDAALEQGGTVLVGTLNMGGKIKVRLTRH